MKKLSEKHKRAVDCYFNNGMNKTQALIDAGYSEKYANKNIHSVFDRPEVITYLEEKQEELRLASKKTREDIIQDLTDVVDEFKMTGVFTAHTLKAIEILNKMMGWNEPDKVDVEHKGIIINMVQPKPRDNNGDGD